MDPALTDGNFVVPDDVASGFQPDTSSSGLAPTFEEWRHYEATSRSLDTEGISTEREVNGPLDESHAHDLLVQDSWRLYPLPDEEIARSGRDLQINPADACPKKRSFDSFAEDIQSIMAAQAWLQEEFPDLLPSVPLFDDRRVTLGVPNPFDVDGVIRHPRLGANQDISAGIPNNGLVNGLVKFRIQLQEKTKEISSQLANQLRREKERNQSSPGQSNIREHFLSYLPPDFGRGLKLHPTDSKLFRFYVLAFCAGRTLLPKSNGFLNDITPMASRSDCVKHAMIALAAGYVLDYQPSKDLERRASMHHRRAVILLGQELNKEENYAPGKEEAVIATLLLLYMVEVVNWEVDRPQSKIPTWLNATWTAKMILDKSDPGYRYTRPLNVQSTGARRYIGSKIALADILSAVAAPLSNTHSKCQYPWLLEGSEEEVTKIEGLNGLSPKLLHIYAQITHLAYRLRSHPESIVVPKAGEILAKRLEHFQQWSDFSLGFPTAEALLESCILDEKGKVNDAAKTIELIADSYTLAARLYLQCRLFRQPRNCPTVEGITKTLLRCIDYMPTSGPLFTAQAPLFSVFIAGLCAHRPEDHDVVRNWFLPIVGGTRGNVPPTWRVLRSIWTWQDENLNDNNHRLVDDIRLDERRPWWEEMVQEIENREEESRRRGKGKGGAFAILESEDLSQVTRGSRAPMKHFKSPFIGYSVDEVYDFYEQNIKSREHFTTQTFAILDDKTVSEKLCLLASEVKGELKTVRSEFAPSLECMVPFEYSTMNLDSFNVHMGRVITLALMEKWDADGEANAKRAKEQGEQIEK